MVKGSCLCGGVKYSITGPLTDARNCHCSICRKAHGAAFRTRASVQTEDFTLEAGEKLITFFESSPGTHRGFCGTCGSPIFSKFDMNPSQYGVPFGALDDDPGVRPAVHVHVASKAPWHSIDDSLPQYPEIPT